MSKFALNIVEEKMLAVDNGKIVFDIDKCQQCGVCEAVCPTEAISLKLRSDGTDDVVVDQAKCILCRKCVRACPSNVVNDYTDYFSSFPDKKYFLGYSTDESVRRYSSSGGVCRTLIIEALKGDKVDGVYSLVGTPEYPYAKGRFYTRNSIPEYKEIPNSVYHSVPACREVAEIQKCRRLIIVGTACQLRALAPLVRSRCEELISVCIFCKQQKTLDSTRFLAKIMGTEIGDDLNFSASYRGDGWPGVVKVNGARLKWARAAQVPFGRRLFTVPGCDICGDSFGTLAGADVTLMDPWNIREDNARGETLVIVHTPAGRDILHGVGNLHLDEITYKEAKKALSLGDVRAKQIVEPYFRGIPCGAEAVKAGKAEERQRGILRGIVDSMPRMPLIFYRVLCKIPDFRNRVLNTFKN